MSAAERHAVLERPAVAAGEAIVASVKDILLAVRERGDAALRELTLKLDKAE